MNRIARLMMPLLAAMWFSHSALAQADTNTKSGLTSLDAGVLLMAHGGSKEWNEQVMNVAAEVNKTLPTEVAFGMADRTSLQEATNKLVARGAKQIVAVPLFISSHSGVIESTRYLLGLRADPPAENSMPGMDHSEIKQPDRATIAPPIPVKCPVPLRMTPALDNHPVLGEILADQAAALSKDPRHEVVILVAHGPNSDDENALWLADMAVLAKQVAARIAFARIEYVTLRDDAEPSVRDHATAELRSDVAIADEGGYHVLIVPVLLSYGGIENGLRQRLDGLEHTMSPRGLLPDRRFAEWVLDNVTREEKVAAMAAGRQ
jgi:sirohydrochlorin cobaltochelatase